MPFLKPSSFAVDLIFKERFTYVGDEGYEGGNDYEISINDLAQKIIKETNSKSEKIYVPYVEAYGDGFEDMERRVPSIELIFVHWAV